MTRRPKDATPEDFLKRLSTVDPTTSCWNWKHLHNNRGFCTTYYWAKVYKVHRPYQLSYLIYKGPYDRNLTIFHLCHNSRCINPDHLCVETHQDNQARRKENSSLYNRISENDKIVVKTMYDTNKLTVSQIAKNLSMDGLKVRTILKMFDITSFIKGSKLSPTQVAEIRKLRLEGNKLLYLASLYNVTESTISRICSGSRRK